MIRGYIKRSAEAAIMRNAQEYPVITLAGPRQSGKTTLARHLFPNHVYVNLEMPESRNLAKRDPKAFMNRYSMPVIFDEVQRVPELLSYVQVAVDERTHHSKSRVLAEWILTGSNQLALRAAVSQSLAGRTAITELLPLSINEVKTVLGGKKSSAAGLILKGFLPRIWAHDIRPQTAWRDYYRTYVERDVRQLIQLGDVTAFERFMKLLAGRTGQLLNLNSLANQVGVAQTTLGRWLSVLEASYVVFRLPPYFQNVGKRLTKSPKIYFTDPAMAAYLLGIETEDQLERDPAYGHLFENLVMSEALKSRFNKSEEAGMYFYRDHNQNEIDLLFPVDGILRPIEIKSAQTFNKLFLKGIRYYQKILSEKLAVADENIPLGTVAYDGDLEFDSDSYQVQHYSNVFS